ncbi:hypothetical protein SALBM217S_00615 [Streptomyces griseoloalbus]
MSPGTEVAGTRMTSRTRRVAGSGTGGSGTCRPGAGWGSSTLLADAAVATAAR